MKIRSLIQILALGIFLSMTSCSNESMINGGGENPLPQVPEGMARLELITNSDDYQEPATRAVGDKLNRTPWILVFKDTGTPANDVFVEARQAIVFNGISYVMLTKTEPIVNERKRRLLVIANSEKFRTTAAPSTEISMSEANLEAQLINKTFSQTTQFLLTSAPLATRQITVPYTPDEPIPMSVEYKLPNGITKDTKIGGGESGDTPLKLRRAVAKVTVAVSNDPAADFGNFTLHGATVVDAPRDGYLCPPATLKNNAGNLTDYLTSVTGDGVTGIAPAGNVSGTVTTAAHPIYVYESQAGVTSVIIKGAYKGTTGYYRLAFVDNDNANAPMSVLRNTHYKFNIVKVTGTGYPSVAEAKKNPPAHDILAKIEVSDDKSHDIISNGRYYLGCSNSEFLVYADGAKSNLIALTITTNATAADILADGTNSITATTTGGTAMTVSPAKITLNTSGAAKGTETNVTVTLPVGFTASSKGTITLKLGNLVKTITVRRQPMLNYGAMSKEFATNYVSGEVTAGSAWLSLGVVNDPEQSSAQVTRPDQQGSVYLFAKDNSKTIGGTIRTGGEVYLVRHNNQGRVKIYTEQDARQPYPAYPGVIGYDPDTKTLNLDGKGFMVYFKFGSVIAMHARFDNDPWSSDDVAFNPSLIDDLSNYSSVPYDHGTTFPAQVIEAGLGDPCKLVGHKVGDVSDNTKSGWRLPIQEQFSGFTLDKSTWTTKAATAAGDFTPRYGRTFTELDEFTYGNFLPAAGHRGDYGSVGGQNTNQGRYWINAPYNATLSYRMNFYNTAVTTTLGSSKAYGYAVRCVAAPPPPPSYPAYPGVIGYDPDTETLNLDGKGVMVYFKSGGVIAMYAGLNGDTWSSNAIAFNPSSITAFGIYPKVPHGNGTTQNIKGGLGDPCKLIGYKEGEVPDDPNSGWISPTREQYSEFTTEKSTWTTAAATAAGDATLRNGRTFTEIGGKFLPAAGCRAYSNGSVNSQNKFANYWSSTSRNADFGYYLRFDSDITDINLNGSKEYGFPVRCIRKP